VAATIESATVRTRRGDVPVRVHRPAGALGTGLVWAHGGGFLGGDLDMPEADRVARSLADRGVLVVSVDYALAPVPVGYTFRPIAPRPGVHYPVASEQVTDAFRWAADAGLGVPPDRWSLGGASAGANLAAGAALRLRDEAGTQPAGLVLVYALLHYRIPTDPAVPAARDDGAATYLQDNYLGSASPEAAYAFAGGKDLAGLPPTFVLNAEIDGLRPSGEAFAAELAAAGVDVLQLREHGAEHGYLNEPDDPAAARSIVRIGDWITGEALHGGR
jgi:acetyl esterase